MRSDIQYLLCFESVGDDAPVDREWGKTTLEILFNGQIDLIFNHHNWFRLSQLNPSSIYSNLQSQ